MSGLDFFAQVVVTGRVLGLTTASAPGQWAGKLGENYIDDRRKGRMRRDFGLVEISFQRVREVWQCFAVAIQVHRLSSGRDDVVPAPIRAEFGEFGSRVTFAELDAVVARMGHQLHNDNDEASTYHDRFVLPESNALIHVVSQVDDPDAGGPQAGDVWSIHLSQRGTQV